MKSTTLFAILVVHAYASAGKQCVSIGVFCDKYRAQRSFRENFWLGPPTPPGGVHDLTDQISYFRCMFVYKFKRAAVRRRRTFWGIGGSETLRKQCFRRYLDAKSSKFSACGETWRVQLALFFGMGRRASTTLCTADCWHFHVLQMVDMSYIICKCFCITGLPPLSDVLSFVKW